MKIYPLNPSQLKWIFAIFAQTLITPDLEEKTRCG